MKTRRPVPPNTPQEMRVQATTKGVPIAVDGHRVEEIRNDWMIEDRWWTLTRLRRRYWEVLTSTGRCLVLLRDLDTGRWWGQGG
jgi:hypothetical protein